jgi:CheY-like chemotaxis protein
MPKRPSIAHRRRSTFHGLSVLFVDESDDERDLFAARFGPDCAQLESASSVECALAVLDRGETELVITEIHLAGFNGFELVRRMRELPRSMAGAVPAIAASAWIGPDYWSVLPPSEFAGYVVKPYETGDLLAVVADVSWAIAALRRMRARNGADCVGERELGSHSRSRTKDASAAFTDVDRSIRNPSRN